MGCGCSKPVSPQQYPKAATDISEGTVPKPQPQEEPTVLDLSNNPPEQVSGVLSAPRYASTTELVLQNCQMTDLPDEISSLTSLIKLDASSNKLAALPNTIGKLVKLTHLDVNDNALKAFPEEIGQCVELIELLAYKNSLTALPETLRGLKKLGVVNFFNNKILKLTHATGQLESATEVNFSANKVMRVEAQNIELWTNVTIFNIYDCRVVVLPSLSHFEALEELRLFGNQLQKMPDFGAGLPSLKILELHRNQITEIKPEFFTSHRALTRLTLTGNQLTELPPTIGSGALDTILVEDNKLTALPEELATLLTLRVIMLKGNQITSLPAAFQQNTTIQRINLEGNPVSGSADVLAHLEQTCKNKEGGMFWKP